MSNIRYYTMIGSRETPKEILEIMCKLSNKLSRWLYCGRSGGADGADHCLEVGLSDLIKNNSAEGKMEVYLPWKDFNGRDSSKSGYYTLPYLNNKKQAEEIASKIHPAWDRCSQGAQKLHTRNVYQLLGLDLKTPSDFVICYAKPKYEDRRTEEVKGGTATAVKLGIDNNVKIYNLYWDDVKEMCLDWVAKEENNNGN